jgi:hypothetical protein
MTLPGPVLMVLCIPNAAILCFERQWDCQFSKFCRCRVTLRKPAYAGTDCMSRRLLSSVFRNGTTQGCCQSTVRALDHSKTAMGRSKSTQTIEFQLPGTPPTDPKFEGKCISGNLGILGMFLHAPPSPYGMLKTHKGPSVET